MGFGVSGSTAIIFLALLVSIGVSYEAYSVTTEVITDAREENEERLLDRHNTEISFGTVVNDTANGMLVVQVVNTGSTTLTVSGTDLIADNVLVSEMATTVDGNTATDLWHPGETLEMTTSLSPGPRRIKVVTRGGISVSGWVADLEAP